jgi:hypothetical protein
VELNSVLKKILNRWKFILIMTFLFVLVFLFISYRIGYNGSLSVIIGKIDGLLLYNSNNFIAKLKAIEPSVYIDLKECTESIVKITVSGANKDDTVQKVLNIKKMIERIHNLRYNHLVSEREKRITELQQYIDILYSSSKKHEQSEKYKNETNTFIIENNLNQAASVYAAELEKYKKISPESLTYPTEIIVGKTNKILTPIKGIIIGATFGSSLSLIFIALFEMVEGVLLTKKSTKNE